MTKTVLNSICISLVSLFAVACGDPGGAPLDPDPELGHENPHTLSMLAAVVFGPCKHGEHTYARQLRDEIPDDSLTIVDRGFQASSVLKTDMLERNVPVRSQTPQGVRQELRGVLLAYNLVRREMEQVAKEANMSPRECQLHRVLSFHP